MAEEVAEVTAPDESGTEAPVEQQGEATTPQEQVTDQTATDGGEPAAEPAGGGDDDHKKPPRGVQKRLDELTKEKYEWKREADYWREAATKDSRAAETQKADTDEKLGNGKPKSEDFEDYNDYVEALTDWKTEDKFRKLSETREQESKQLSERQAIQEQFNSSVETSKGKHPDFEDVISSAQGVPCSQDMLGAIMDSPEGAEVMYFLAKNPAEATRISKLSPMGQIREIGKIESRLAVPTKTPEPKRITQTGEPVKTVSGAGVTERDPGKMSMEEYAAWRQTGAHI